ncbi:MAG: hypothetical protein FWC73_00200 [Defluviitaleaceae bacterium]|nr:hypothetical protein [Defluviitaleaceae bacterium]
MNSRDDSVLRDLLLSFGPAGTATAGTAIITFMIHLLGVVINEGIFIAMYFSIIATVGFIIFRLYKLYKTDNNKPKYRSKFKNIILAFGIFGAIMSFIMFLGYASSYYYTFFDYLVTSTPIARFELSTIIIITVFCIGYLVKPTAQERLYVCLRHVIFVSFNAITIFIFIANRFWSSSETINSGGVTPHTMLGTFVICSCLSQLIAQFAPRISPAIKVVML